MTSGLRSDETVRVVEIEQKCLLGCCHKVQFVSVPAALVNTPVLATSSKIGVVVACFSTEKQKAIVQERNEYLATPTSPRGFIKPLLFESNTRSFLRFATEADIKKWIDETKRQIREARS